MDNSVRLSRTQQNLMNVVNPTEISGCPGDTKVDPRKRRTRKMLEEAIRSLLTERPLAEISVIDIAERADLNRATFYAHFNGKEELASAVLRDGLERAIFERLEAVKRFHAGSLGSVATATFEYIDRISNGCAKHGDGLKDSVGATLQETLTDFFSLWFKRDPAAAGYFPSVPADVVATTLAWSLYGGAIRWSRLANRPPVAEAAKQVVDILVVDRPASPDAGN